MALVAGVDSSTQSVKVRVVDARTGQVVREGRAAHPEGTRCPPSLWWQALESAACGLLDDAGEVIRPALLWNDTRSAPDADDLVAELGGPAARAVRVVLPHDWLTWRLTGAGGEPTTDRGDASGTGHWSPATGTYRLDLLEAAFGRALGVPRVAAPAEVVGTTPTGVLVGPGTGDNMAAAPDLPDATGQLHGITRANLTPANLARACVEGMLAGLAEAVDALVAAGVRPMRVLLVGGAAASPAVRAVATTLVDVPVHVPPAGEYVALGAARQAAWALAGTPEPPPWELTGTRRFVPAPRPGLRAAYAAARARAYPAGR